METEADIVRSANTSQLGCCAPYYYTGRLGNVNNDIIFSPPRIRIVSIILCSAITKENCIRNDEQTNCDSYYFTMGLNYFRALTGILHCLSRCSLLYHHYCRFRWSVHWCTYNKLPIRVHRAVYVYISVAPWHTEAQNICKLSFSFAQIDAFVLAGTRKFCDARTNAQQKWQDRFWIERCAMPDIGCQQRQIDVYCFGLRMIERCQFLFVWLRHKHFHWH